LTTPLELSARQSGMSITFAQELDVEKAENPANYEVKTWELKRSSEYGSDRYNSQTLEIAQALVEEDGKTVKLVLPGIAPIDVMTISYEVEDIKGNKLEGTIQNTIHNLRPEPKIQLEASSP